MKEEEIIKVLNDYIISPYKCDTCKYCNGQRNTQQAIQGLLDLYEKEKQKNIYLTQELETRKWVKVKENGEVEPAFYISKDKIRKKVIEIKNKKAENDFITTTQGKLDTIIALESLLEEE